VLERNLVKLMTTADDHSVSKHKRHEVSKLNIRKICTLSHILLYIFKMSDYIILNITLKQKIQNDEILTRIDMTRGHNVL